MFTATIFVLRHANDDFQQSRLLCLLSGSFGTFGLAGGQLILLFLAVDRLVAIAAPLCYIKQMQSVSAGASGAQCLFLSCSFRSIGLLEWQV